MRKYSLRPLDGDYDRLTVYVPRKSLAALKERAKTRRVSVSQDVSEAIDKHLERCRRVPAAS